jgi:alkanesulfonate monooxygenase SsuD/methylene tetrahydromethanopterin reductase-like flavin-dependent oxidoreductase (luciferase family)
MTTLSGAGASPHWSLILPNQPDNLTSVRAFGQLAQELSARRLWTGQSLRIESHHVLVALAMAFPGLPLGSSVVLAPLRHPYQAATEARSIALLSGATYVAGYGPGGAEFQQAVTGSPVDRPLRLMREYLSVMRGLLDHGQVDHKGDYYTVQARLAPLAAPPVEVALGVLRPGMARLAGLIADTAVTWLTPPWYVRDQLAPSLRAGATRAGRSIPRVAMVVHVAVDRPLRNMRHIVNTAVGAHLRTPHYTDMLKRAGVRVDPNDPTAGAQALLDADVFVTGTPGRIAETLRTYRAGGADEIILNISGVFATAGESAAMRDLRAVVEAGAGA